MDKPSILAIVGSLRKDSFNRQLALAARDVLGERAVFTLLDFTDVRRISENLLQIIRFM